MVKEIEAQHIAEFLVDLIPIGVEKPELRVGALDHPDLPRLTDGVRIEVEAEHRRGAALDGLEAKVSVVTGDIQNRLAG